MSKPAGKKSNPVANSASSALNAITDLESNDVGYTEAELIASGRIAQVQPDGTKYYPGFFQLANGSYWPMNSSALQDADLKQDSESIPDQIVSSIPTATNTSGKLLNSTTTDESTSGKSDCHPNYNICLPIVDDLNCSDISEKGFTRTGGDPYKLDRNNDGICCEN